MVILRDTYKFGVSVLWVKIHKCKEQGHHQVGYVDFDDMEISVFCSVCNTEIRIAIPDTRCKCDRCTS